jgi:hypothetical protein
MTNLDFLDIISILSFLIGIENLKLNEEQVNGLNKHLSKQDDILVKEQNEMLKKIIEQNKEIIKMIKEATFYAQEDDKRSNR